MEEITIKNTRFFMPKVWILWLGGITDKDNINELDQIWSSIKIAKFKFYTEKGEQISKIGLIVKFDPLAGNMEIDTNPETIKLYSEK